MVPVNPPPATGHVAQLVGGLLDAIRTEYLVHEWDGLRPSHIRVLSAVPDRGVSITELAARVGMTKQGCGQFVTTLVGSGHLAEVRGTDRRTRLVTRTPLGDRTLERFSAVMDALEGRWRVAVGERRYVTFRAVLSELAAAPTGSAEGFPPG